MLEPIDIIELKQLFGWIRMLIHIFMGHYHYSLILILNFNMMIGKDLLNNNAIKSGAIDQHHPQVSQGQ